MSVAPVNQILDAFESRIIAEFPEATVDVNRVRSLADDQGELQHFNIQMGADEPSDGGNTFDTLSATLNVKVKMTDQGADSRDLMARMVENRSRLHRRLMGAAGIGLPFFHQVGWLGATEPVTDSKGIGIAAEIETRWVVLYTFNRDDPNTTVQ